MNQPEVTLIVCGRFHFHKYVKFLYLQKVLKKFIYSYKIHYDFGISKKYVKNFFFKEYLMYLGKLFAKGNLFNKYLILLHNLWQYQVIKLKPKGNIVHFLVHGNCYKVVEKYRKKGIKVIGEVVNVHPTEQERLLKVEYANYDLVYNAAEKHFKNSIIKELGLCDFCLVPSSFVKESLVKNGIDGNKIKVLPYGLDETEKVKETNIIHRNRKLKLLYIGQVSFRKGVIYLLKANDALAAAGIECETTIVGSISADYLPVISRYQNHPNVHFIHHIDNSNIPDLMLQNDVLIVPSIEDGFGVVVAEALSVHLPVIVTENCGASEIVINGKNGFIINAFSDTEIYNAVRKSIEYPFVFDIPILRWSEYADILTKFYQSVLQ